jgi:hypothetical protein
MSVISLTKLYDLLSAKVGKDLAENLTTFIEDKIKDEVENKSQMLTTKEDLLKTESRLDLRISETKNETLKWMFIFWISQVAATFGFILLFLKK